MLSLSWNKHRFLFCPPSSFCLYLSVLWIFLFRTLSKYVACFDFLHSVSIMISNVIYAVLCIIFFDKSYSVMWIYQFYSFINQLMNIRVVSTFGLVLMLLLWKFMYKFVWTCVHLYYQIMFCCIDTTHLFINWWTFGYFSLLAITNNTAENTSV